MFKMIFRAIRARLRSRIIHGDGSKDEKWLWLVVHENLREE